MQSAAERPVGADRSPGLAALSAGETEAAVRILRPFGASRLRLRVASCGAIGIVRWFIVWP